MYSFAYSRPDSLDALKAALAELDDPQVMAGGMTLIPTLKQRLAMPGTVVDLGGVAELRGVSRDGDRLRVGAMTNHAEVAASPDIEATIPALAYLAKQIGDIQVRNRGTIGGSVANSDPAADYPSAVLALDTLIETTQREIGADAFFLGMFETALEEGEIITGFRFRIPDAAAYAKFANPASRYAVVGAFVARFADGVRVGITGAATHGFRWTAAEDALSSDFRAEALDGIAAPDVDLNSDIHASADYRAHLIGVMTRRALAKMA